KISDDYPVAARTEARWWWAVAAQQILSEKCTEKERQTYQEQFLRALESIPEPDIKERSEIVRIYVRARLQLGSALYENQAFERLEILAGTLQKRLPQFEDLDVGFKKELLRSADSLVNYCQYGKASTGVKAGTNMAAHRKLGEASLAKVAVQVKETRAEEA